MTAIPGRWGAVVTAMVTPFHDDLSLDVDGAVALARWLADHGSDGLVVTGTTGESPTLSDDEKITLWRSVSEAVTIPVIAGAGTYDTAHSVHLTKAATRAGAAAILAVAPYYNRPSQAGLDVHFRAVAAATDLPVMLYDVPIRTGRRIDNDTTIRLARDVPNIVALKDAAQSPGLTAAIVADAPAGFEVYSGDDLLTLPFLSVGAVGVVSVAAHWCGRQIQDVFTAYAKGDVDEARRANERLLTSYALISCDATPSPAPTKTVMRLLGQPAGPCRPPMVIAPADQDDLDSRARAVLAGLEGA